mgnify:CR=1 FL=1
MRIKENCLSYWFPKIEAAGLPVPRTEILRTSVELIRLCDGESPAGFAEFIGSLERAAEKVGYPCFLRTGQTSGKHRWKRTCFVPDAEALPSHVASIVEFSECCCLEGLPCDVWAVREMLPTEPAMVLPRYGDMPLCREFRCFVRDGNVECVHGYWPTDAVLNGIGPVTEERRADILSLAVGLCDWRPPEQDARVRELASAAGRAIGGHWSVDVLDTKRGWMVTDMAVAEDSWHWPDCPSNPKKSAVSYLPPQVPSF